MIDKYDDFINEKKNDISDEVLNAVVSVFQKSIESLNESTFIHFFGNTNPTIYRNEKKGLIEVKDLGLTSDLELSREIGLEQRLEIIEDLQFLYEAVIDWNNEQECIFLILTKAEVIKKSEFILSAQVDKLLELEEVKNNLKSQTTIKKFNL